ncbi:MAG TPA: phosphohydrolase [Burkholderiaceae bacterium]|nr:phosphohydrolase [Burkholderiaceae bacterium]
MTEEAAVVADPPPFADVADAAPAQPPKPSETIDAWDVEQRQWAVLLRQDAPDAAWLAQFEATAERLRRLAQRDPDAALYLLLQSAAGDLDRYSAHHAMLCAVVCDLCAQNQAWSADEADALWRAALSMNLALTVTQDSLARQIGPLSAAQRELVDAHAESSARMLSDAGATDALWLDVVRRHHERGAGAAASPAERLAALLHRVDVYTAKLSRRATREPTSPAIAARDACLDADGRPDAIGATLLRTIGLYPPGCFVELASGEVGVVIRRGAKAHTPVAAALRRHDGGLYLQPLRRDTALARYAIKRGVNAKAVRVHMNHPRTLAA